MGKRYFEDFEVGKKLDAGKYKVSRNEVVEFAQKWDPQPIHIDDESTRSPHGGIIAPGCYIISVAILLVNGVDAKPEVIAAIGWDEIRFHLPVRPGDELGLTIECIDKRDSENKLNGGINYEK